MSTIDTKAESPAGGLAFLRGEENVVFSLLKLIGLIVLDAMALIFIYGFLYNDQIALAVIMGFITVLMNLVIFIPALYPIKWMAPGLMLVILLVIFPIYYTVSVAFTNYGDGHLFTKDSAIDLIAGRGYVPEGAQTYGWVPFVAGEGEYALWLTGEDGNLFFALPGQSIQPVNLADDLGVTFAEDDTVPSITGFEVLEDTSTLANIEDLNYDSPIGTVRIDTLDLETIYLFDIEQSLIFDQTSGDLFETTVFANDAGQFVFWLIPAGGGTVDEAIYILADGDVGEVNLDDETALDDLNIELASGRTIPDAIADFNRVDDAQSRAEELNALQIEAAGLSTGTINLEDRFVFDIARGLTLDVQEGDVYETTVLVNDEQAYALWLQDSTTYLALPTGTVIVNGVPIQYQGYEQIVDAFSRNQALSFLQNIDFEYFGEGTDTLGIINTRQAGRPYLLRYVWNEVEGTFIDLSSIDGIVDVTQLDTNALAAANILETPGMLAATLYDADNREGIFAPRRIRFIYNEERDAYIDMFSVQGSNVGDLTAQRVASEVPESVGIFGPELFTFYEDESVFVNTDYVFNAGAGVFIDPGSSDADAETLASANLTQLESTEGITIYRRHGETNLFVPDNYIYNRPLDGFIDMASIDATAQDFVGIDLADIVSESIDDIIAAPQYTFYDDLGVYAPLEYVFTAGDGVGTFDDTSPGGDNYVFDEPTDLFIPETFVYNTTDELFIDTDDVDPEDLSFNFTTVDTRQVRIVAAAPQYSLDDLREDFGLVYADTAEMVLNETSGAYLNVAELNPGEGLNLETVDPNLLGNTTLYTFYEDQGVYAPQNFIYAESTNTFTVEEATIGTTTFVFDEANALYTPDYLTYNETEPAYIDARNIVEEANALGIDLATVNLDAIDDFADAIISVENAREDYGFFYDADDLYFNETANAYLYLQRVDLSGIDIEAVSIESLVQLSDASQILARPDINRAIVYGSELTFADSGTGSNNFVLAESTRADQLNPGYRVSVGLRNFTQLADDSSLLEPLIQVFLWTVLFALLSVLTTFALGLFMALILNDARIPGKKIIRSLLIVPYAIPGVIGILVWRGMLNENLGIVTRAIADTFGADIPWFSDSTWAKVAIIMVNLWLGYPYMMLVCSGALQAIPSDVYEAAAVDGARPWQRFWNITLPLLLITVGPLLIASFTFNFNNYLLIEALTRGDPPIAGTSTPAGQTDILISYTYNLAFGTGRGADYGYASAITLVIFALVGMITLFQYRFTKQWEEVGENV